ncbi:MAG: prenyltransferase/squalene oxidase repeat-containing protein [Acetobacteraceae bacterium]
MTGWAAAAARGTERLLAQQGTAGCWEGEVVWCPVITAQVVLAYAVMRRPIPEDRRRLILRHFARTRRPDGGWGLHPESHAYLFVTTLVYVAARLLDEPPGGALLHDATVWLRRHKQGLGTLPSWGRFWLVLLGLYERDRLTVCPAEFFLLPSSFPIAADRLYCHTRAIYLGMAYLTGIRLQADLGPLGETLRQELASFTCPGHQPRYEIAATDVYVPPGRGLRITYEIMRRLGPVWHKVPGSAGLRRRALARCLSRIRAAQIGSAYQGLSPVNGLLNTLALWAHDPNGDDTQASIAGLEAWCWRDEADGLRYAGARSTSWDTAFALQALIEDGDVSPDQHPVLRRAYAGLASLQLTTPPAVLEEGRQDPVGGWCFGEPAHGWTVSDCAAEAVSALLLCHGVAHLIAPEDRIPDDRITAAVGFLLTRQNDDGGFGTYERRRGGSFLERLNPSEMFGACMTERSYIECSASAIRALHHIIVCSPASVDAPMRAACQQAIGRARDFLLHSQRNDGAWAGFWGINFIYATGFAVTALRDAGLPMDHPSIQQAVSFLCMTQRDDGSWGEHFSGCLTGSYVGNPTGLVISTSWAVLALLRASADLLPAARRGLDWLAARQQPDGDWPRDSVNGVFFGTAMLDYRLYNTYFPLWALRLGNRRALSVAVARSEP